MHDTSVTQRVHSHAARHSYALSPSHHRTIIKLARTRIVDDVRDHPEYRPVRIPRFILFPQHLLLPIFQILQVRLRMSAIPLYAELALPLCLVAAVALLLRSA